MPHKELKNLLNFVIPIDDTQVQKFHLTISRHLICISNLQRTVLNSISSPYQEVGYHLFSLCYPIFKLLDSPDFSLAIHA